MSAVSLVNTPFALAHNWTVDNECVWNDPAPYFYMFGAQSSWTFHTTGGNCHVDSKLIGGTTVTAWAAWYLPVSTSYNHQYYVAAYIDCNASTHRAPYVYYRMHTAGSSQGYYTEFRDQRNYCGWMSLDHYTFTATLGGQVRVVNTTGCPSCVGKTFQVNEMTWAEVPWW
ncbi:MAG TPA: hypothetical protein VFW03_26520 [Gemmatimonadaceae bacterium]|nr:hypothetical protein [Gemmatimonadaceae bacterium]